MGHPRGDRVSGRYGQEPGRHDPDCGFVVRNVNCTCPYAEAWVPDVESVAQRVVEVAVTEALATGVIDFDLDALPEDVWEAVAERARYLATDPWNDHHPAYDRLSTLGEPR